jgi:hypothetical protein
MILRATLFSWILLILTTVANNPPSYAGTLESESEGFLTKNKAVSAACETYEIDWLSEEHHLALYPHEDIVLTAKDPKENPNNPEDAKIRGLKEQIIEMRNKGKLGFRKVVLCSDVRSFGIYSPLEKGKPTKRLVLYFEPANVSTLVSKDRYVIDCTVDMFVTDANGKVLGAKKNAKRIGGVASSPVIDLFFTLSFKFKKPRKEGFVVRAVLHDNIKNDKASVVIRIGSNKKGASVSNEI